MNKSYQVEVFLVVDFDVTGENHVSISGGRATHSFDKVGSLSASSPSEVLSKIEKTYGGKPYLFDNRLELQTSDSETLSFYVSEVEELNNSDLKSLFPKIEEN